MKLVDGEALQEIIVAFVIFGDGSFDKRILRSILDKFDGKCAVVVPTFSFLTIGGESTTRALAWLIDNKQKFSKFPSKILIIIDKEHEETLLKSLKTRFLFEFFSREENLIRASISRTEAGYFDLIVVLMGTKRRIEENIAILIEDYIGVSVKPNKKEISKTLKQIGLTPEELVARLNKNQLEKAFRKLVEVLEELETACNNLSKSLCCDSKSN